MKYRNVYLLTAFGSVSLKVFTIECCLSNWHFQWNSVCVCITEWYRMEENECAIIIAEIQALKPAAGVAGLGGHGALT